MTKNFAESYGGATEAEIQTHVRRVKTWDAASDPEFLGGALGERKKEQSI